LKLKRIELGKIVKPQGIKGEVKVLHYVDRPEGFLETQTVLLNGVPRKITSARYASGSVYLCFEGVTDRNTAELLRGGELTIEREKSDCFKSTDFFIDDLLGLKVVCGEQDLGIVVDITNYGTADIISVKGEKNFSIPYIKKIVHPQPENGILLIDSEEFSSIVLYED